MRIRRFALTLVVMALTVVALWPAARSADDLLMMLPPQTLVACRLSEVDKHLDLARTLLEGVIDKEQFGKLPRALGMSQIVVGVTPGGLDSVLLAELNPDMTQAKFEHTLTLLMPRAEDVTFEDVQGLRQCKFPNLNFGFAYAIKETGNRTLLVASVLPASVSAILAEGKRRTLGDADTFKAQYASAEKAGLTKRPLLALAREGAAEKLKKPLGDSSDMFQKVVWPLSGLGSVSTMDLGADLVGEIAMIDLRLSFGEGQRGAWSMLFAGEKPAAKPAEEAWPVLSGLSVDCDVALSCALKGPQMVDGLSKIMAVIDKEIADEFATELDDLSKEAGVDVRKSLIAPVSGFSLSLKLPRKAGDDPQLAAICRLSDPDGFKQGLLALMKLGQVGEVPERRERDAWAVRFGNTPMPVSLAIKENRFLFGSARQALETMLCADDTPESLAEYAPVAAMLKTLPAEPTFVAGIDILSAIAAGEGQGVAAQAREGERAILLMSAGSQDDTATVSARLERKAMERLKNRLIPEVAKARLEARRQASMNQLKQIELACIMYSNDHKDVLPAQLSQVLAYVGGGASLFLSPTDRRWATIEKDEIDQKSSYALNAQLAGVTIDRITNPSTAPLVMERAEDYEDGTTVVGFVDGHVEVVTKEKLAELLKKVELKPE